MFALVIAIMFTFTPWMPMGQVSAAENDSLLTVQLTGEKATAVGAKATWEKTYWEPGDPYDEDGDGISDGYLNDGYLNAVGEFIDETTTSGAGRIYTQYERPIYHAELLGTEKPQVIWWDTDEDGKLDSWETTWTANYDKAELYVWNDKTEEFDDVLVADLFDEVAYNAAVGPAEAQFADAMQARENALTAANKVANEAVSGPYFDARVARDNAYAAAEEVRKEAKEAALDSYNAATKPALKAKKDAYYYAGKALEVATKAALDAYKAAVKPHDDAKTAAINNAEVAYVAAEQAADKAHDDAVTAAQQAYNTAYPNAWTAYTAAITEAAVAYYTADANFSSDPSRQEIIQNARTERSRVKSSADEVYRAAVTAAGVVYENTISPAGVAMRTAYTAANEAYRNALADAKAVYDVASASAIASDDKAAKRKAELDYDVAVDAAAYAHDAAYDAAYTAYKADFDAAEKARSDAIEAAQDVKDAAFKAADKAYKATAEKPFEAVYKLTVKPALDRFNTVDASARNTYLKPLEDARSAVIGNVIGNVPRGDIQYYYDYGRDDFYYESGSKIGSATKARLNALDAARKDQAVAIKAAEKIYAANVDPASATQVVALIKAYDANDAAKKKADDDFKLVVDPLVKLREDSEKAADKAFRLAVKSTDDWFYQVLGGLYNRAAYDAAVEAAETAVVAAVTQLYVKPAFEFRLDSGYSGQTATVKYLNSAVTKADYGQYASQVIGGYFGDLAYSYYENGKQFATFKLAFKSGKQSVKYALAKAVLQTAKVAPQNAPLAYQKNYHKDANDNPLPGVPTGRINGIQYYVDYDETTPAADPDPNTGLLVPTNWKETWLNGYVITKNDASSAAYGSVKPLKIVTEKYDPNTRQYVQTWEYTNPYTGTYVFPALAGTKMIFQAGGKFSDASQYSTGEYKPAKEYQTAWLGGYKSTYIEGNPTTVKKVTIEKKAKVVGTIKLSAAKGTITGTIADVNGQTPSAIGVGKDSVTRHGVVNGTDKQRATQTEYFDYFGGASKIVVNAEETYSVATDAVQVPVNKDTEKLQWVGATEAEYLAYVAGVDAAPAETYLNMTVKTGIPYVARLKDDPKTKASFDGYEKAVIKDNSFHDKWIVASLDEYVAYVSAGDTGLEWYGKDVHTYPYVVKVDEEFSPVTNGAIEVGRDEYYAWKNAGYPVLEVYKDKDNVYRYYRYDSREITRDEYYTFPNSRWVHKTSELFQNAAGQWEPKYFRYNTLGTVIQVADREAYDKLPDALKASEYNYFDKAVNGMRYFAKNQSYLKAIPVYSYTKDATKYVIDGLQAGIYAVSYDGQVKLVTLKANACVRANFKDPATIDTPYNFAKVTTRITGTKVKGKKLTASSYVTAANFGAAAPTYRYYWTDGAKILSKKAAYKLTKTTAKKNLFVLTVATTGKYQQIAGDSSDPWLSVPGNNYGKVGFAVTVTQAKNKFKKGQTVKATIGAEQVTGAKYTYQWLRNGKAIKKATKSSYKLTKKDKGKRISVKVTGTRDGYTKASVTSAKTAKIK
jgi:hypothetical protein